MPGENVDQFKPGEWVGFSKNKREILSHSDSYNTVFQVVDTYSSGDELFVRVKGYKKGYSEGTGGFYPESLLTAEETEAILYHCSYCGKEGHNRRTCEKFLLDSGESTLMKKFVRGEKVNDLSSLNKGDFFFVQPRSGAHTSSAFASLIKTYGESVYEIKNIEWDEDNDYEIDSRVVSGNAGAFGAEFYFSTSGWEIFYADEEGVKEFKTLSTWDLVSKVLPISRLTLLYGPPGTGKTTAGNFLGDPQEVYNITLTEETPAAELRGHFVPKGGEFVWMDGPALSAFKRGARLVLNEIDKASGDALTFCHALLDDPGIANITLPYKDESGETVSVKPHEDFHVVATMNGEPEDLPEALRDRFAVRIHVDKVHPNAIKSLPKELQKIATKGVSSDGDRSISIRGWNAFVQLREVIGEESAAQAVFGSRAKTILNTIKIDSLAVK